MVPDPLEKNDNDEPKKLEEKSPAKQDVKDELANRPIDGLLPKIAEFIVQ